MLWAGDTRRKLLVNVAVYAGDVGIVTATAPGSDVLSDPETVAAWNKSAPRRWRELHRAASQRARRQHGVFTLLARSWEFQKRGALHTHVAVGLQTARERAAAQTYVNALSDLAGGFGFGWVDRGRRTAGRRAIAVIQGETAGRYLAKYLSPLDSAGKPTLSATVTRAEVPANVVYVSTKLTLVSGVTMRSLRHARWCWVLGIEPRTGELVRESAVRDRWLAARETPALGP